VGKEPVYLLFNTEKYGWHPPLREQNAGYNVVGICEDGVYLRKENQKTGKK